MLRSIDTASTGPAPATSNRDHDGPARVSGTYMADGPGRIRQRICCVEHRHELARFNEGLQGDQIRPVLELYRRPGLLAYEECRQVRLDQVAQRAAGMPSPVGQQPALGVRARRVSARE